MASETFDGYLRGILSRPHPRATAQGFLREALNVVFQGGRVKSRPGIRPFHGASLAGNIKGMGWHVTATGEQQKLAAAGSAIQRVPQGGDPITLALTNLPSTLQTRTEPSTAHFLSLSGGLNITIVFDGVNTNLVWTGTSLNRMGLAAGLTPSVPVAAAGNITPGTRKYVMTLDSGRHEGNPTALGSERTVTIAAGGGNKKETFTSPTALAIDDPSVTQWGLWRTEDAKEDYFLIERADIGVSIEDNLTDATLAAGTALEEINNALPEGPFVTLCEHRGQLVGVTASDLNLLRWSNLDPSYPVPEGWPSDWTTPIAHGDGDEISAVVSFFEWLVVFKKNSTWAVTGTWPDTQVVPVLASGGGEHIGIGVQNEGAVFHLENEIIFASRDAFYVIERYASVTGGIQARRVSGAIDELYAAAHFEFSADCAFDRKRRVFISFTHG